MPEDHRITIDGKAWLLRFTKLKGDAAGWTFFDNSARPRILIDETSRGWSRVEAITRTAGKPGGCGCGGRKKWLNEKGVEVQKAIRAAAKAAYGF